MLQYVPAVQSDALLEQVIPETLDSVHPLPVINSDGQVRGKLSRATLAEVLSEHTAPLEEEKKRVNNARLLKPPNRADLFTWLILRPAETLEGIRLDLFLK